jgi:hypothetical protein
MTDKEVAERLKEAKTNVQNVENKVISFLATGSKVSITNKEFVESYTY